MEVYSRNLYTIKPRFENIVVLNSVLDKVVTEKNVSVVWQNFGPRFSTWQPFHADTYIISHMSLRWQTNEIRFWTNHFSNSFPEWITFENQGSTIILSTNVNPINSIKTERLGKKVLLRILRLTSSHLRPGQIFVNTPVGPHRSGTLKRFLQNSIKHIDSVHLTN